MTKNNVSGKRNRIGEKGKERKRKKSKRRPTERELIMKGEKEENLYE